MPALKRILLFATFVTFQLSALGEKPFDFVSTPGKLPKHVLPQEYAIRIKPDFNKLTFSGSTSIKIEVKKPTREVILNALELKFSDVAIDGKPLPRSALKMDEKQELVTLTAPGELAAGNHTIDLAYTGKINQAGQGLFYARYQEHGAGAKKIMLGTQLEATDARRVFPCWDEPSFRARFQLTAVIPENYVAISNMPVESEKKSKDGKEVRFAVTPSMASYLNVLAVGEFDVIEMQRSGVQLRVIATKGKGETGRYALESSAQILDYFNDYFEVPYPLPKLDMIAVPGGFSGAMENWGGITYFESKLLFDPEKSSERTRQDIYEVIAHEMAHQWFGNLVTMAWWDNLWLNEGFASWMGSKCTAHFNPQWEVWLRKDIGRDPTRRTGISKETAMEDDARTTTHPIQQPIATEAEAGSAFDAITYNKGQAFIRMLEVFLGEEVFRKGIRDYMAKHSYSNTTTADLWAALAEASGKPVGEIAPGWTEQPGFPLISATRDADGKVSLTQERFSVNAVKIPPLEWKIPVTYTVSGQTAPKSHLMTEKTATLADIPADAPLKLNIEGAGNYRVKYDDGLWNLLLKEVPKLSIADRVNLLSDAWALVHANRGSLGHYIDVVEKLPSATELAEQEQIMNTFDFINRLMADQPEHEHFQKYARALLRRSFDQAGWTPKKGEPAMLGSLRVNLIAALGDLGDEEIIKGCKERFVAFLADPNSLAPDLRPSILGVVGRHADAPTWTKLHELGKATTSIEEKQNYYDALSASSDPKLVQRALQIALTDELPTSRAVYLVARVARDSGHPNLAWDFARKNMKALLAKADALAVNKYAPSLFTFFSEPGRIQELQEYAKANLPAASEKEVAKAVDEIGFRAELKDRLRPQIKALKPSTDPARSSG